MRTRFAPSPTGLLHLGHAYSALVAWDLAQNTNGEFLLRIEDIDTTRSRPEYEQACYDDLHWLGLNWSTPVMRQSDRMAAYTDALNQLIALNLCYPCSCTRKYITEALSAPQEGAAQQFGPDGVIYPRTCCNRPMSDRKPNDAIRLDMRKAAKAISYKDSGQDIEVTAKTMIETCGDIVLARKDIGTSYHLAVTVDDAAQNITDVVRGQDMAPATPIHVLLQTLLDFQTPTYHHHELIRDENGKRLAKRHDALSIQSYKDKDFSPQDIRQLLGLG